MADVTIQASKNGPLLVKGPIQLTDPEGKPVAMNPGGSVALCRCGHSEKKPLCDGSHRKVNFQG
ncbi:MAG TPA: CDGSH iron-sulfur domain-containing protein [Candidatus Omnitrophota bacterium]|nr:CDGSH iron-sulfur domain-containing protein [Candidatus Omnitrophota bacterium]